MMVAAQPQRCEMVKLSRDPRFAEEHKDIVDIASIPCIDEKTQTQALEPHAAGAADEAGPRRHHDPRLAFAVVLDRIDLAVRPRTVRLLQ